MLQHGKWKNSEIDLLAPPLPRSAGPEHGQGIGADYLRILAFLISLRFLGNTAIWETLTRERTTPGYVALMVLVSASETRKHARRWNRTNPCEEKANYVEDQRFGWKLREWCRQ